MKCLAVFSLAAACACGGGVDCDTNDRSGTYLVTYTYRTGDCGELGSAIVTAGQSHGPGVGCALLSSELSDDKCTVDSSVECDDHNTNQKTIMSMSTEQMDDDGELLEGSIVITVRSLGTGQMVCNGTYGLTLDRQ